MSTYSDFDTKYEIDRDFVALRYSRKDFNDAKWKPTSDYDKPLSTGKKLDDKYRLL